MVKVKISDWKADSSMDEAYKALRTNIQFCGADKKVIAFTSCTPNEGKSNVTFHLAASLAGVAGVYIFGLLHLYLIVNFWMPGNGMPLMKVLSIGFLGTIAGDIIKAFLSSVIAIRIRKTLVFRGI